VTAKRRRLTVARPGPAVPASPTPAVLFRPNLHDAAPLPYIQRIELLLDEQTVARLTWHCLDSAEGAMQILDWHVDPAMRRRGYGVLLFNAAIDQADRLCRQRGLRLRRVWVAARQKTQIVGRSLLTRLGFHHVGVAPNVAADEDLMMYVKTFD
jgi:GNAT superfamily N-acetyltransferase